VSAPSFVGLNLHFCTFFCTNPLTPRLPPFFFSNLPPSYFYIHLNISLVVCMPTPPPTCRPKKFFSVPIFSVFLLPENLLLTPHPFSFCRFPPPTTTPLRFLVFGAFLDRLLAFPRCTSTSFPPPTYNHPPPFVLLPTNQTTPPQPLKAFQLTADHPSLFLPPCSQNGKGLFKFFFRSCILQCGTPLL